MVVGNKVEFDDESDKNDVCIFNETGTSIDDEELFVEVVILEIIVVLVLLKLVLLLVVVLLLLVVVLIVAVLVLVVLYGIELLIVVIMLLVLLLNVSMFMVLVRVDIFIPNEGDDINGIVTIECWEEGDGNGDDNTDDDDDDANISLFSCNGVWFLNCIFDEVRKLLEEVWYVAGYV